MKMMTFFGRNVPSNPRLEGGVKGHNMNEIFSPGSLPCVWGASLSFVVDFRRKVPVGGGKLPLSYFCCKPLRMKPSKIISEVRLFIAVII